MSPQIEMAEILKCARALMDGRMSRARSYKKVEGLLRELHSALHDSIDSPKGIVPKSAEKFYDPSYWKGPTP